MFRKILISIVAVLLLSSFCFCSVVLSDNETVVHVSAKEATSSSFSPVAGFDSVLYKKPNTSGFKEAVNSSSTVATDIMNYWNKPFRDIDFESKVSRDSIPYYSNWDTIAYLSMPSIGLDRVPITYGWSQTICDNVDICMCPWSGMKFGEEYLPVICGHNYKIFSELHNLEVGDDVLIETEYGANFRYKVSQSCKSLLIEPHDFEGLKDMDGEWVAHTYEKTNDVLVFTCYDMNQNDYRWGVRLKCVEHNLDS